ncbi:hypothetical protein LUZ61_011376 [Rhynchospora tenuis]|uniref:Reverse transcriptase domain-containing protein n=1 Tax=Rhynchospora tenuis TaxID=198213 RepID=A0AAD6A0V7_9POAL|nr:hypothetical protein LUZ61_011376 [Rhynchospora tenuis]
MGRSVSDPVELQSAFLNHFTSIIGSSPPHPPPFDLSGKLGVSSDLSEILLAINQLPSGKASGLDGFPIDFFKKFWDIIKTDLMRGFLAFQDCSLDLSKLNKAYISLVPKKESCTVFSDYRPISVINSFVKIITKVLANRLQPHIKDLVSPLQTAFTKDRSIMESFMVTRKFISFYHKNKLPAILYKVDFAKAFDTVSWTFLTHILIERGFPPVWISWILQILRSSSSTVKVNGLRQGDPLSPLLFIIVTDALQSFFNNASSLISGLVLISPRALQYADDTIILMEANSRSLLVVSEILSNFASLSGLRVNDAKCLFVPISIDESVLPNIASILRCQAKELPITYMGLPLSIRRPKKIHFQPLISAFQRKLDGWKARFLSLGGRLTLIKSVLMALPLHFMQVLKLPPWLIRHLKGIRRRFFWKGNSKCLGGHCLVNWSKCCLPKANGGLGILDLQRQNQALLLKWLWKLKHDPYSVWSSTVQLLYGTLDINQLISSPVSYGLTDILQQGPFFNISLVDANPTAIWKWTANGIFSSSSAYGVLSNTGTISKFHHALWKVKSPPRVKIFLWLLLQDRLLTQQNLMVRGWPSPASCPCCSSGLLETTDHLFLHCNYASLVWSLVQLRFRLPSLNHTLGIDDFWLSQRPSGLKIWDIIWAATTWNIWKERNRRIFSNCSLPVHLLLKEILVNIDTWKKFA